MGFLATLHDTRGTWTGPYSAKDPALARLFGSGYEAAAGIRVTNDNAFCFSAVFDAVNQISSDVAKLPLKLMKRREGGGADPYDDSKLYKLLKSEPNPEMGSMVFRRTMLAHALTCHGGFAEIERDRFDRPAALWLIEPDRIEPHREHRDAPLRYRVDGKDFLEPRDVLHIHGLGYDGINGYGTIAKARQTIGLALAMERFGAQYFGKGTVFGGWLETDEELDDEQKNGIRQWIEAFRNAQDSAFRVLVTEGGRKFHQFETNPSDSQMDESRVRQVEEVARFFRMPPHRLGVTTPGAMSYASVEAANLDYYTGALLDWITLSEQEYERKLISPLERRSQFIKHNANAFLRADTSARSAFYEKLLDRGVINADEVRELEDWNPQSSGQGQLYLVQAAQMPKDLLVEKARADIEKAKQPPPTPQPQLSQGGDDGEAARARIRELEQLVDEARIDAQVAKESLAAAQSAGTSTAEELAIRRTEATAAQATVDRLTLMVNELRTTNEQHAAAAASAEERRLAAEARAVELGADLEAAKQAAARAAQAFQQAAEAVSQAEARANQAQAKATELESVAAAETTGKADAEAARDKANKEARAAQQLAEEAQAAKIEAEKSDAEARSLVKSLEAQRDTAKAAAASLEAALQESKAMAAQVEAERVAALARVEAEAAAAEQRAKDLDALAGKLTEAERNHAQQIDALIAKHHALFVQEFGRMARRQAAQARERQATPAKLRRWHESYRSVEESRCLDQGLVQSLADLHLTWLGSDRDRGEFARQLVAQHLDRFDALIWSVVDVPADEFHVALERALVQWETTQPGQIADGLLQEALAHVRRS